MAESGVVRAGVLDVAFERHGEPGGWPVVLLAGNCWAGVLRALTPYVWLWTLVFSFP